MAKFSRDEKYTGHSNEKIKYFKQKLVELENEKLKINAAIQEIRDNCDHEFLYVCSGMYEDNFQCKHCGEEKDV